MVKAATQATIPVQSKTSERIRMAQMDLFLSQLMQLPIFSTFLIRKATIKHEKRYEKHSKSKNLNQLVKITPCVFSSVNQIVWYLLDFSQFSDKFCRFISPDFFLSVFFFSGKKL